MNDADLNDLKLAKDKLESRLACMEVFTFDSPKKKADDDVETGYFAVRASLAQSVSAVAHHISGKGLAAESNPALVRMINLIAQRFSIQISEKVAAQAISAIDAAGGALINILFIDHFQAMAHGHFAIRRLERSYSRDEIRDAYLYS